MNYRTLILPGWGVPPECYSDYAQSSSYIYDYGYFSDEQKELNLDAMSPEIDSLITNDSVVVAHSMGSAIALKAAAELKDIKALVLFSPFARFTADLDYLGQAQSSVDIMTRMITSRPEVVLRGFYRDTFFPAKSTIDIPVNQDCLALMGGLKFLASVDYRSLLESIDIPVLIIQGEVDQIVNPKIAEYLHSNIANSEYVCLPKVGHALPLTNSEQCRKIMADFFDKNGIKL